MSQYGQFRSWSRASSGAEKGALAATAVLVLGLLGWALVPTGSPTGGTTLGAAPGVTATTEPGSPAAGTGPAPSTDASSAGAGAPSSGPGTTATAAAATTGGTTGGTAGGTTGGTTAGTTGAGPSTPAGTTTTSGSGKGTVVHPSASASAASPCGQLTATDVGVTPTEIHLAVVTLELAGAIGNSAVGLASEQQQEQMAQAMADDINAHGGVACRKLVLTFFKGNPIDPSTAHQACLDIVSGGFFAAIDLGGLSNPPGVGDCVPQNKVPYFASDGLTPGEQKQYSPYIMSLSFNTVAMQRNAILAMNARGFFSPANGFKKLGIFMDDCSAEVNQATFDALASIGIARSQISVAEYACPSGGFPSPNVAEAAVIQHVRDGVTNVIPVDGGGGFKEYTVAAQQQRFKPKYTTTDYAGMEITATGGTGPDPSNFDGTVSVSISKIGENTSGLSDPVTQHCIEVFKRHGLSPDLVFPSAADKYPAGGSLCSTFETVARAIDKDPGLKRTGIATGLDSLGHVPLAYLLADAVFDRPGKVTGGDYYWVVQFSAACTCWHVIDKAPRPLLS